MSPDVIVIGTGQAGVPLATRLAAAGKRVLVAERAEVGGTCTNYGCTPTKTMIASARAAHVAYTARRLGVRVDGVHVDFAAVVARKDEMVRRWQEGVRHRLDEAHERLLLVEGQARFVGPHEIEIGRERHRADRVVINVGARAAVPQIPGLGEVPWLDSHRILELRELPKHLVVIGGGYVGCELAQMFRRFGSEVSIADHSAHLLAREDDEVSDALEKAFRGEGIELHQGTGIRSVDGGPGAVRVVLSSGLEIRGSHLVVATGRAPNTDDLGCEAAGIERDAKGFVKAGEHYETTAKGVYAVGDAIPQPQFTHTSWDDHRLLFDHLMDRATRARSDRIIPSTVFTDPQVARVGVTEREAKASRMIYEAATLPFGQIARAIETDETAGIMKVLIEPKDERILGAAIVGAEAGELIHVFVALMQAGAPARTIVDAEIVHPTFAEGLQALVMRLGRYALRS